MTVSRLRHGNRNGNRQNRRPAVTIGTVELRLVGTAI
jgi:hypothetical protein